MSVLDSQSSQRNALMKGFLTKFSCCNDVLGPSGTWGYLGCCIRGYINRMRSRRRNRRRDTEVSCGVMTEGTSERWTLVNIGEQFYFGEMRNDTLSHVGVQTGKKSNTPQIEERLCRRSERNRRRSKDAEQKLKRKGATVIHRVADLWTTSVASRTRKLRKLRKRFSTADARRLEEERKRAVEEEQQNLRQNAETATSKLTAINLHKTTSINQRLVNVQRSWNKVVDNAALSCADPVLVVRYPSEVADSLSR